MDHDLDAVLGFAPDYDAPIPYMQRTRDYYAAIGYTTPYRWAHYIDAPFTPLRKPLARVARGARSPPPRRIEPDKGDQGPGAPYNGGAKFYEVVFRRHVAGRTTCASRISATTARTPRATDSGTWFPLPALLTRGGRRADRRGHAALPRRADQPQPSRHDRDRRAGNPRAAAARTASTPRSWCRTARSATRPSAWSRATWRRTAFRPS